MIALIVYLGCDDEAKAKLRAEETEDHLQLKGNTGDPDRTQLIHKIIETIAHET